MGITEHLNDSIPLALEFLNEEGQKVRLGSYFEGKKPVILTLNYSNCPMLCSLQLDGFVEGLIGVDLVPGKDFEILTVSIDPQEKPTRAKMTKQRYLKEYGRAEAKTGWHFLTGEEKNIQALARAVGFGYQYVPEHKEFAHAPALFLLTPDGRVGRYLYGVIYESKTLRLSLLETSEGRIGSTVDKIILYCFHYDAKAGSYALVATNVMRLGGLLTLIGLILFIGILKLREHTKQKAVDAGHSA